MATKPPDHSQPRRLPDPSPTRQQWVDHQLSIYRLHLHNGHYPLLRAAIDRSEAEDPDLDLEPRAYTVQERLDMAIGGHISIRSCNYLEALGIETVGELAAVSRDELLASAGIGPGLIAELDALFAKLQIKWLKRDVPRIRRAG